MSSEAKSSKRTRDDSATYCKKHDFEYANHESFRTHWSRYHGDEPLPSADDARKVIKRGFVGQTDGVALPTDEPGNAVQTADDAHDCESILCVQHDLKYRTKASFRDHWSGKHRGSRCKIVPFGSAAHRSWRDSSNLDDLFAAVESASDNAQNDDQDDRPLEDSIELVTEVKRRKIEPNRAAEQQLAEQPAEGQNSEKIVPEKAEFEVEAGPFGTLVSDMVKLHQCQNDAPAAGDERFMSDVSTYSDARIAQDIRVAEADDGRLAEQKANTERVRAALSDWVAQIETNHANQLWQNRAKLGTLYLEKMQRARRKVNAL